MLGWLIERVSGMSVAAYTAQKLWEPLGMDADDVVRPEADDPHVRVARDRQLQIARQGALHAIRIVFLLKGEHHLGGFALVAVVLPLTHFAS